MASILMACRKVFTNIARQVYNNFWRIKSHTRTIIARCAYDFLMSCVEKRCRSLVVENFGHAQNYVTVVRHFLSNTIFLRGQSDVARYSHVRRTMSLY